MWSYVWNCVICTSAQHTHTRAQVYIYSRWTLSHSINQPWLRTWFDYYILCWIWMKKKHASARSISAQLRAELNKAFESIDIISIGDIVWCDSITSTRTQLKWLMRNLQCKLCWKHVFDFWHNLCGCAFPFFFFFSFIEAFYLDSRWHPSTCIRDTTKISDRNVRHETKRNRWRSSWCPLISVPTLSIPNWMVWNECDIKHKLEENKMDSAEVSISSSLPLKMWGTNMAVLCDTINSSIDEARVAAHSFTLSFFHSCHLFAHLNACFHIAVVLFAF